MNKSGRWAIWVAIVLLVILIIGIFFYFALFNPRNNIYYSDLEAKGQLINPVSSLTNEEAVEQFNESFVYYLLVSIKAYNLHNPPLSSDTPKMEVYVGDDLYSGEVKNGIIYIYKSGLDEKDIIIRTTKEEAVKMMRSQSYVAMSFEEGKSSLEKVESASTLFSKGYLNLYNELTGKGVTGNVVRMYVD